MVKAQSDFCDIIENYVKPNCVDQKCIQTHSANAPAEAKPAITELFSDLPNPSSTCPLTSGPVDVLKLVENDPNLLYQVKVICAVLDCLEKQGLTFVLNPICADVMSCPLHA
ncbi:hypothetical protein Anas_07810 [Armadillidium nasatum]|uniref:Uncharacterized protein n=1 Tax=Armadillidium nasatum TaxID=96803 RepID=A0A5N5SL19_9CRUS|nr:hypothetical protein Anas_07810 [Armadillidium nasatum]